MSRNSLYGIIALLVIIVVGFGVYLMYQESQKPGLDIKINERGISVDAN